MTKEFKVLIALLAATYYALIMFSYIDEKSRLQCTTGSMSERDLRRLLLKVAAVATLAGYILTYVLLHMN